MGFTLTIAYLLIVLTNSALWNLKSKAAPVPAPAPLSHASSPFPGQFYQGYAGVGHHTLHPSKQGDQSGHFGVVAPRTLSEQLPGPEESENPKRGWKLW